MPSASRRDESWSCADYFADPLAFGAGGFFSGGFFGEEAALADGATEALASTVGVGAGGGVGAGAGFGSGAFGCQTSPPDGPTAIGVYGAGRSLLPHAAMPTTSITSRTTSRRMERGEEDRRMRAMVARLAPMHNDFSRGYARSGSRRSPIAILKNHPCPLAPNVSAAP